MEPSSNYHTILNILKDITYLKSKVCCCEGDIGITTLNPPVDAPGNGDPTILFNLDTGTLFYWDGNSWAIYVPTVSSGTYTPVYTEFDNITGTPAAQLAIYRRIGDTVTVSGCITGLAITGTSAWGRFYLTLPIASTFSGTYDLVGSITAVTNGISYSGTIFSDISTNRALVFLDGQISALNYTYTFTYKII